MRPAEALLVELGVTSTEDIDVDAIAQCVGAEVYCRRLVGCEAQIVGKGDKAIIFVRDGVSPSRRRFSVGHELGHWHHHRGQSFSCRSTDIGLPPEPSSANAERVADRYAADLLFPEYLFNPAMSALGELTLGGIVGLATAFKASITATAIRSIRLTRDPVILVAHRYLGRSWQWPSISVGSLKVRNDLDPRATVSTLLAGGDKSLPGRREPANYWFDRKHVEQFEVRTESVRTYDGEILSLIRILDRRMIEIYG